MEKKKSDYAIIVSCNPAYEFGMISTMNAMNYFKTDADWEVAYEGYTDQQREKISNAFPFRVNWTLISELLPMINDKRTVNKTALDKYWVSYWLLAHKVLKEKKYKAVCVIQADEFVFTNLDAYFKIAEAGILVNSEHAFTFFNAEDLPFGDDKAIWDRSMCHIFDAINFIGQEYTQMPMDIVHYQEEDPFKGESNHSVIALNRSVCKHGKKGKVLGLDRNLWVCDHIWPYTKLYIGAGGVGVYNDRKIQLRGWHCRWWQEGRVKGEWKNNKDEIIKNYNQGNKEFMWWFDNKENNYGIVKSFMEKFNNMKPEIKSENYMKGKIKRPKFELGET